MNASSSNNLFSLNVDSLIQRLLAVKGTKPLKDANITEQEIRALITNVHVVFMNQPMFLALKAPVNICGNIFIIKEISTANTEIFSECLISAGIHRWLTTYF